MNLNPALQIQGTADFTMKNRKGMKKIAPKRAEKCIHACTRSVNETKPSQSMELIHFHALPVLHGSSNLGI